MLNKKKSLIILLIICCIFCSSCGIKKENKNPPYDTVVIVGIDGAGAFFKDLDTPFFDNIFSSGTITYDMKASVPTESAENWGAMIYGVKPEVHGLNYDIVTCEKFSNNQLHSIFYYIDKQFPNKSMASISGWKSINTGIIDFNKDSFYKKPSTMGASSMTGEDVVNCFKYYLERNRSPKFIFIQIDDVDHAGHEYGYGTEGYYKVIKKIDKEIGNIYDMLEEKNFLSNTLFIVTTDHGGTLEKTHGGNSQEEIQSVFAVCGYGVLHNGVIRDMETRDVAAIVLYALGIDIPTQFSGRIPAGIWENVGSEDRIEP